MADEPIQVDLPEPPKQPRAKKVRQAWPTEFDPNRSPPGSYEVKIPDDLWKLIHGETPLAVYALRGKKPPEVTDRVRNDLGNMGDILRVDKGCSRCGARVYVVIPDGAKCVGCGTILQ